MDDGAEGYMTPHVNRQGIPVCRRGNLCGVVNTDTDVRHQQRAPCQQRR